MSHARHLTKYRYLCRGQTATTMKPTTLLAKRIYSAIDGNPRGISSLAIKISVCGIALGIAVIILSVAIITGFKQEVKDKIYGFTADARVCNLDYATPYAASPASFTDTLATALTAVPGVKHIQPYSITPGMVKTDDDFQGVILKGVDSLYDTAYLTASLLEGHLPDAIDGHAGKGEIMVSRIFADKLGLKTGDDIYAYFFNKSLKARKLTVCGIYQTNINEHDNLFALTDKATVDRLNGWQDTQATGVEIMMHDGADRDAAIDSIYSLLYGQWENEGLTVEVPEEIYPDIFSWLGVLDTNVTVILVLMIGLSAFSVVSGLLIILLERIGTIGILKALGADNRFVKRVFSGIAAMIVARGLLWGNAIGLGIYILQRVSHVFSLDPAVYYVDHVPVDITVPHVIGINLLVAAVALAVFLLPSMMISRVNPTKTMKFD